MGRVPVSPPARHPQTVERVNNVLLVPVDALFNSGGQDVVYVLSRNGAERRPVVIERRNADHAVIKEGIAPGERVALEDPTIVAGGARP